MGKLHELLAVEGDLEGTFKSILKETEHSFSKKPGLFFGYNKRLEMFSEAASQSQSQSLTTPEEVQQITTTVSEKMDYVSTHVTRYFDALLQKEATNQEAKADLIVDGKTIAKDLPATFLLGMESRLKKLRDVLQAIPTLPPGKRWQPDENKGKDVYICPDNEEKFKTARTVKHKVLYDATEHHPAQIERWEETENVGKYVTVHWSGMIPVSKKSDILARIDKLIQAAKKARQRANTTEVKKATIGKQIFEYLQI
jgi:hypothetical protein